MSEHNHECECGCGCGCDHDHEEEVMNITLTLEDDTELECEVVAIFPASNDKQYIAVTPANEESEDLYFFRLDPDPDNEDEAILCDIEDDEEMEIATDAFDELLDDEEWNELNADE